MKHLYCMSYCCCGQQQKLCALAAVRDQEVFAANIAAGAAGGSAPFAAPEEGSALAKTGAPTASSFEVVAADAGSAVSFITTVEIRFDLNLSRLDPNRAGWDEKGGGKIPFVPGQVCLVHLSLLLFDSCPAGADARIQVATMVRTLEASQAWQNAAWYPDKMLVRRDNRSWAGIC